MKVNDFRRLCLSTYWENGDTCKGCPLHEKDVCNKQSPAQLCKTAHAYTLLLFVRKREKIKKNANKDEIDRMFEQIEKKNARLNPAR